MGEMHFVQHFLTGFSFGGQTPDFPFPPFGEEFMRPFAESFLEIHLQPAHRNAQVHRRQMRLLPQAADEFPLQAGTVRQEWRAFRRQPKTNRTEKDVIRL